MKTIGSLLIAAGIMLMAYAFTLETSVEVNYQNGNSLGLPNRINNIGLMADKQNYLIGSGVLLIVGLILCYLPQSQPKKEKERKNKRCPQCAEQVLEEAKVCRFCNYTFKVEETVKPINKLLC